jgi:hypothetical protein
MFIVVLGQEGGGMNFAKSSPHLYTNIDLKVYVLPQNQQFLNYHLYC